MYVWILCKIIFSCSKFYSSRRFENREETIEKIVVDWWKQNFTGCYTVLQHKKVKVCKISIFHCSEWAFFVLLWNINTKYFVCTLHERCIFHFYAHYYAYSIFVLLYHVLLLCALTLHKFLDFTFCLKIRHR